jgi:hypothetical protein
LSDEWIEVDAREVDDNEEYLDNFLLEADAKLDTDTLLSKLFKFVSSGAANPNAKSEQDKEVKRVDSLKYFKVRYRYTGNASPKRGFCKAMMSKQSRLFRLEDIDAMSQRAVNAGFGEGGAAYIRHFLSTKAGRACHHKWMRQAFVTFVRGRGKGTHRKSEANRNSCGSGNKDDKVS